MAKHPTLESIFRRAHKSDEYMTTIIEASKERCVVSLYWQSEKMAHEFEISGDKALWINKYLHKE